MVTIDLNQLIKSLQKEKDIIQSRIDQNRRELDRINKQIIDLKAKQAEYEQITE